MTPDKDDETLDNVIPFEEVKRRATASEEEEDPAIVAQRAEKHAALRAFEHEVGELAQKHGIEALVLLTMLANDVPDNPDALDPCYHAVGIDFGGREVGDVELILESMAEKFDRLANALLDGTAVAPE